jgi:hypothetical protein
MRALNTWELVVSLFLICWIAFAAYAVGRKHRAPPHFMGPPGPRGPAGAPGVTLEQVENRVRLQDGYIDHTVSSLKNNFRNETELIKARLERLENQPAKPLRPSYPPTMALLPRELTDEMLNKLEQCILLPGSEEYPEMERQRIYAKAIYQTLVHQSTPPRRRKSDQ